MNISNRSNKYLIDLIKSSKIMAITIFIILSLAASCYSTPGWAEEYIETKNGNVIYTCESEPEKGIVLCKQGENNYFVTNIYRDSYSFYPNHILGNSKKLGFFAFNESTYEVNYFEDYEQLVRFKKDNNLGYSYEEKERILFFSLVIPFFVIVIIFFIFNFWKKRDFQINRLRKMFSKYYVTTYLLSKILSFVIGYLFINDEGNFFAPKNITWNLLYPLLLFFPWTIFYRDFKRITCKKELAGHSFLYILFLLLDFWVITTSYYISDISDLAWRLAIIFVLLCNLLFIVIYLLAVLVSTILKKIVSIKSPHVA